jgi:hypothetical protein
VTHENPPSTPPRHVLILLLILVGIPCALLIPRIINIQNTVEAADIVEVDTVEAQSEFVAPAAEHDHPDCPPVIGEGDYPGIGEDHREILVEQRTLVRRAIEQADSLEESLDEIR